MENAFDFKDHENGIVVVDFGRASIQRNGVRIPDPASPDWISSGVSPDPEVYPAAALVPTLDDVRILA